ncbi:response regulator [Segetibacter sp. 3557_3]|uniref:LytR/AlgR family response regulator transcription factor n=1 Tax=Segetibacter sp. 3557_3 TaxID=2547429 RepID=UPI0010586374|nr:LytTR family transcriptional regulator DNA-binding domain-containing protein [Segetibacter sp. 3557_3]TDH23044.1 response regulator [Segetibacter sp. 3557_3]
MKTIIIDDEPLARSLVREYLKPYPNIEIIQECNDGFEGIKAIQQHEPDLIFLDIQMPKITGFEMLELVDKLPQVIFTTAFEEYAIKAFETHAVDYLLKPFSQERFDKAMQKAITQTKVLPPTASILETAAHSPVQTNRIVVKDGGKIKIIPTANIRYMEGADDYVKIYTEQGAFLKKKTMAYFEEVLNPQAFLRIHRSYIINIQLITRIDPYEKESHVVVLTTGEKLPVSKAGYAKLKAALGI